MANKKLLIGLLAVMLVLGGCPESEEGVKDDGKDAPKTVKYESTDTAGKTYIFIITVSGSGVAEGDSYVLTIKEAGQPDKVITGTVLEKGTDGALTLKQNGSEAPLSVNVNNGQMTAINGPIAVEGGEPITAPGPLTPIVNNNNNGGEEEIDTGGNWLRRKEINYKVSNGVASVSGETNYNWIIYRVTSNMDYEQKYTYTYTSTGGSGTTTGNDHYIMKATSDTNYEQTQTESSTTTDSSGAMIQQLSYSLHQIRNGQTETYTQTYMQTYMQTQSNGQFVKQTQTLTIEYHTATDLRLRVAGTVTNDTNIPGYPSGTQTVERNWTIELLSDTDGIKTYKYHETSEDEGEYTVYKFQNGRTVEKSEYRNGVLSSTYTYNNDNTETTTRVTIKEGLSVTTESSGNYYETVTVLSDTGSEVVVRKQRFNNSNVLTEQTDTTYRK